MKLKERPLADDRVVLQRVGLLVRGLSVLERMRGAEGVLVTEVLEESASAQVGVQAGDLILAVNERRVTDPNDLLARLAASAAVQETQLTVKRGSERLDFTLPLVLDR